MPFLHAKRSSYLSGGADMPAHLQPPELSVLAPLIVSMRSRSSVFLLPYVCAPVRLYQSGAALPVLAAVPLEGYDVK